MVVVVPDPAAGRVGGPVVVVVDVGAGTWLPLPQKNVQEPPEGPPTEWARVWPVPSSMKVITATESTKTTATAPMSTLQRTPKSWPVRRRT